MEQERTSNQRIRDESPYRNLLSLLKRPLRSLVSLGWLNEVFVDGGGVHPYLAYHSFLREVRLLLLLHFLLLCLVFSLWGLRSLVPVEMSLPLSSPPLSFVSGPLLSSDRVVVVAVPSLLLLLLLLLPLLPLLLLLLLLLGHSPLYKAYGRARGEGRGGSPCDADGSPTRDRMSWQSTQLRYEWVYGGDCRGVYCSDLE